MSKTHSITIEQCPQGYHRCPHCWSVMVGSEFTELPITYEEHIEQGCDGLPILHQLTLPGILPKRHQIWTKCYTLFTQARDVFSVKKRLKKFDKWMINSNIDQ